MQTYARTLRAAAVALAALTGSLATSAASCQSVETVDAVATSSAVIAIQNTPIALLGHVASPQVGQGTIAGAGRGSVVMLNVHDDESTSVEAALDLLASGGAPGVRLYEIRHSGARLLTVRDAAGDSSIIDPNRMFTDTGARASMERFGGMRPAALSAFRAFADTLLARTGLDTARVVVTLHNNTEANYSARSYLPGAEYATDAARVHIAPGSDADDFFFVTDVALFDALAARGFNAVLQDNARVTDDGSLSVLAARRGQLYVNVEAQHGHRTEQTAMLRALLDVLAAMETTGR